VHLINHDVSYVRVSRAPLDKLLAYKKRLGWTAEWVSSWGNDFNYDFHVSFTKEQLATGEVYYNYQMTKDGFDELPGSACSPRTMLATSITPIRATRAATKR